MTTEEASVKVYDNREGLVPDKKGVNSSMSLSLQEAEMSDHQMLEVYKARELNVRELGSVRGHK